MLDGLLLNNSMLFQAKDSNWWNSSLTTLLDIKIAIPKYMLTAYSIQLHHASQDKKDAGDQEVLNQETENGLIVLVKLIACH